MKNKNRILLGSKRIATGIAGIFMFAMFTSASCIACDCNGGMSNTGVGCSAVFRDTNGLILMPMYDNDGNQNGIPVDGSITLNKTYFDGLVNESDVSKRMFPVPNDGGIKDVEQMRAAMVTRTFSDGADEFIRDGIKPFKGWLTGRTAQPFLAGKLNSARCNFMGVYKIDRGGNLIGSISADGTLLCPIAIDSGSFNAVFVEATADKNNAYIEIVFNFSQTEVDQTLKMIACSSFVNYRISAIRGLLDVCVEASNITDTGFDFILGIDGNDVLNPTLVQGLVNSNFTIKNVTDNTTLTATVTEDSTDKGHYSATFASQTTGDEYQLIPAKDGYDFSCVKAAEIVNTGS